MSASKILFVSDLDGTLLQPDATLAKEDALRINRLCADGIQVTYATARTIQSVKTILADLTFMESSPPVCLMNGVLLRDMARKCYVHAARLRPETAAVLYTAMEHAHVYPFIYALQADGSLITYYAKLQNPSMEQFMLERVHRYGKPFTKVMHTDQISGDIVYFCLVASKEDVQRAEAAIAEIAEIRSVSYPDTYAPGTWYLEIFHQSASKKQAVEYLRGCTGVEKIVCFGDNLNDLPMFEAADYAVAVPGAAPEVRAAADAIAREGVVSCIEEIIRHGITSMQARW